jgi:hypothetical protein
VGGLTPERHANAGDGVQRREAPDGVLVTRLPETDLSLAHAREAGCCNTVMLSHPHNTAVFRTLMAWVLVHRLLLTHVPHTELLVSRGSSQESAIGTPGKALYNIGMLEGEIRLAGADIPELDREVAGCGCEDILGGGVEENLSNLPGRQLDTGHGPSVRKNVPRVAGQSADGRNVGDLLGICVKGEALRHLPDEDFAIVRCRGNYAIVERVPVPGLDWASDG